MDESMSPFSCEDHPIKEASHSLSLLQHCRCCHVCCCATGSPIVSSEERSEIIGHTTRDCFVPLGPETEPGAFVIGRRSDGRLRDLGSEPCPYLDDEGACSINAYKPLDCKLYPLKPFYRHGGNRPELAVDSRCPAVIHLNTPYLDVALKQEGKFLTQFSQDHLETYVRQWNSWPSRADHHCPSDAADAAHWRSALTIKIWWRARSSFQKSAGEGVDTLSTEGSAVCYYRPPASVAS
jgi:Fe-S-cluster containining protein